jgi:hypothetical protein
VIPDTQTGLGPETRKRTVDNTVYVKDGETVMIGGILWETQVESVSKIPFLGNIPILGWAFKSRSGSTTKSNLLILLTPHIVRDPQDLERLTVEHREEFRDSAGDTFQRTEEQKEARARALAAGIDLPHDRNPVRRKLESHDRRYPVESMPGLRQEHLQREEERRAEIRREGAQSGGAYRVQVSLHDDQEGALQLLENLMREGYDGTLLSRREQDRVLHLVQLGPYLTEDRARQVAREIGASTGLSTVIIIEP